MTFTCTLETADCKVEVELVEADNYEELVANTGKMIQAAADNGMNFGGVMSESFEEYNCFRELLFVGEASEE